MRSWVSPTPNSSEVKLLGTVSWHGKNKVEILQYYIAKKNSIVIPGDRASLSSVVALCFIAI